MHARMRESSRMSPAAERTRLSASDCLSVTAARHRTVIGWRTEDALVALEMNGQPLPADHGFPARRSRKRSRQGECAST
jgi:DMSO/TMAO reductase YedYZ molybdopterin-dependent catalytic subunit